MYRLSTNGKYVLLIKDLNKTISYEDKSATYLTDDEFNLSNDVKKLERYLHIEKVSDKSNNAATKVETKKSENKSDKKVTSNKNVFINSVNQMNGNPSDTFVKDVNDDIFTEVSNKDNDDVNTENKVETEIKIENKVEASVSDEKLEDKVKKAMENNEEKTEKVKEADVTTEKKTSKKKVGRPAKK